MTEEAQTEAAAPAQEAPAPKPKKKATLSIIMDADANQNDFKNWLKSCPFSFEGGQTVTWENLPAAGQAEEQAA